MRSKRATERDRHFRRGFIPPEREQKPVKVPGWGPRRMSKHQGPLTISEMLYRTGLETPKALAKACRAGQFPVWRFDRMTGRVFWHRLEFEVTMFWRRARKARARP